jgi:pSer/pThr/pTyr-binding forkhead associated (FHA) protein
MPTLTIRRGPQVGRVFQLEQDVVTIGRGTKNDIVINDNDVSRDHCRLVRQGEDYEIHDAGSTNGTFINGQRVTGGRVLKAGQIVELGDMITLEYHDAARAQDPQVVPLSPDSQHDFALVVEIGPSPRRIYTLREDNITIGRDLSNDIVIQDPEVSRWHLQLIRNAAGFSLKDMNSTNGTVLNGVRLNGTKPLKVFDTVELGTAVRLHYIYDTEEARQRVLDDAEVEDAVVAQDNTQERPKTKELPDAELPFARRPKTSRLGTGMQRGALIDHIFIAYAREDWENLVAPLSIALQDAGMELWVDQYLNQGSDDWQIAIEQALHECWLMLLIVSPDALDSRYVRLAYRYFINREKPVIVVSYRPVDALPPEISSLETVPFDPADARRSFQRLIHTIIDRRSS